jgi:hypothetical protein
MIDAHDDLGDAQAPLKVMACMPVHGRLPLLKHTIGRLYRKNHVDKVICVGSYDERATCEKAGAHFIPFHNNPLGRKWNIAFQEAKQFNPDACLFVGSSDFISDNWIPTITKNLDKHDLIGLPGCYFVDISNTYRLVYWPGYDGKRRGESIGIGRVISAKFLDKIGWKPFDDKIDNSLDFSMYSRVMSKNRLLLNTKDIFSLSISTNRWPNKHRFEEHWNGQLKSFKIDNPETWLSENFPETLRIF